jgi:hypothetical protein
MSAQPKPTEPGLAHGDDVLPEHILLHGMDERMTGEFKFEQGRFAGSVFMKQGEPWHAWCRGPEGESAGDEAICEMLKWKDGTCAFVDGVLASVRSTHLPWGYVLRSEPAKKALLAPRSGMVFDPRSHLPRFTIHSPNFPEKTYELRGATLSVGSAPENDVVLQDPAVFAQHCEFYMHETEVNVRDLFTTTGTYVNGQRVTDSPLHIGDVIRVGEVVVKFDVGVKRPVSVREAAEAAAHADTGRRSTPISYESSATQKKKSSEKMRAVLAVALLIMVAGLAIWHFFLK